MALTEECLWWHVHGRAAYCVYHASFRQGVRSARTLGAVAHTAAGAADGAAAGAAAGGGAAAGDVLQTLLEVLLLYIAAYTLDRLWRPLVAELF